MKAKDYFTKLKTQARIQNEAFDKGLEAIPDAEIPDALLIVLEDHFLTRDRALADSEITKKLRAESLNVVDSEIKKFYGILTDKDKASIDSEPSTFEKLKKLNDAVKRTLESKPNTSSNEEYQKNINELTEKLKIVQKEKETLSQEQESKIKEITAAKEKELKTYKLKTDLTGKLSQLEFAKEFTEHPKVKVNTFNTILGEILKNDLDYDEQGNIVVQEIHNGVPKPKFFPGTNDQVTIEKLLDSEVSPYLKRNNADTNGKDQDTTAPRVISTPKTGRTLAQMRAELADS